MSGSGTASHQNNYSFEGEIDRRFNDMSLRLAEMAQRLETQYVRVDVFEATKRLTETEMTQLSTAITKLESRSEWLVRVVGAGVITAAIGVLLAYGRTKTGAP